METLLPTLVPPFPPRPWWERGALVAVLCGHVVLLGLGGWLVLQPRPKVTTGYEQTLGAVDSVLTQHYVTLPKMVQEQLNAVYARQGLQSPGQRQPPPPKK